MYDTYIFKLKCWLWLCDYGECVIGRRKILGSPGSLLLLKVRCGPYKFENAQTNTIPGSTRIYQQVHPLATKTSMHSRHSSIPGILSAATQWSKENHKHRALSLHTRRTRARSRIRDDLAVVSRLLRSRIHYIIVMNHYSPISTI